MGGLVGWWVGVYELVSFGSRVNGLGIECIVE